MRAIFWRALITSALIVIPVLVLAHGDAEWIMRERRYVTATGSHCCGPSDCARAPKGAVVSTATGWRIVEHGQFFDFDTPGLYVSIDADFWWCRRGNSVVCLFSPGAGT